MVGSFNFDMNILLHICCSNCAVYPVKIFKEKGLNLTGFWYNPNIHPFQEYKLRLYSLKELSDRWHFDMFYVNEYKPAEFFKMFKSPHFPESSHTLPWKRSVRLDSEWAGGDFKEGEKGGFERCKSCYRLRLKKTAEEAKKQGFDAFSTTLLISPYQNFEQIVTTGKELEDKYNVIFYLRDFRPNFRVSMALARELGLYKQKYCGCIYSMEERIKKIRNSKSEIRNPKLNFLCLTLCST
jgi:predicted adenine nucleotide alpha hydrolase (AANH) superfamily ATPase